MESLMKLPVVRGVIRRRILLNYRVSPEVVAPLLPANFRPKVVHGHAIAGICLIRLEEIRPACVPRFAGISSENSAHRIAVEWEDGEGVAGEGVFIPRRHSGSRVNSLAGGRLFPGVHHHASFEVTDRDGSISLRVMPDREDTLLVDLEARETWDFPETSIFGSLDESSRFFEEGSTGYSARPDSPTLDGLVLKAGRWEVTPLAVSRVKSSFFDDRSLFPAGSIAFDHALLMRDIPHEWHAGKEMKSRRMRECPC